MVLPIPYGELAGFVVTVCRGPKGYARALRSRNGYTWISYPYELRVHMPYVSPHGREYRERCWTVLKGKNMKGCTIRSRIWKQMRDLGVTMEYVRALRVVEQE